MWGGGRPVAEPPLEKFEPPLAECVGVCVCGGGGGGVVNLRFFGASMKKQFLFAWFGHGKSAQPRLSSDPPLRAEPLDNWGGGGGGGGAIMSPVRPN